MFKFYCKLSGFKKIAFLLATIILSVPVGAAVGFFLGAISITFFPVCCDDTGCYGCFMFNELVGYEATGFLGLWIGSIFSPLAYLLLIIHLESKKRFLMKKPKI